MLTFPLPSDSLCSHFCQKLSHFHQKLRLSAYHFGQKCSLFLFLQYYFLIAFSKNRVNLAKKESYRLIILAENADFSSTPHLKLTRIFAKNPAIFTKSKAIGFSL